MIDTIVLRLHDLKKHSDIATGLLLDTHSARERYSKKDKVRMSLKKVDVANLPYQNYSFIVKEFKYGDTGKTTQVLNGSIDIPSSHYSMAFRVNMDRDFIEFNFSIPKYLYGNNVLQFITHHYRREWMMATHKEWSYQAERLYDRLYDFIHKFFKDRFQDAYVDFSNVEIRRLDLCYNQIFAHKDDALEYLEMCKRMKPSGEKKLENNVRSYKYGLVEAGQSTWFKIYHKGAEFEKHDKRELMKKNAYWKELDAELMSFHKKHSKKKYVNQYPRVDVKGLQDIADRTLRYELKFESKNMSYFFKRYVYRKNNSAWIYKKALYKKLHSKSKGGQERIVLDSKEKKEYDYMSKQMRKVHQFMVNTSDEIKAEQYDSTHKRKHDLEQHFSKELLMFMLERFKSYIDKYKITFQSGQESLLKKLDAYNADVDRRKENFRLQGIDVSKMSQSQRIKKGLQKKNIGKMRMLFELLQSNTWEEIKELNLFPYKTFKRYKDDFEEINNGNVNVSFHALRGQLDYTFRRYYIQTNGKRHFYLTDPNTLRKL